MAYPPSISCSYKQKKVNKTNPLKHVFPEFLNF